MNRNRSREEYRGRASRELMEEVVAEFHASGKTKNAFAREMGIAWITLDRWCAIVSDESGGGRNGSGREQGLKLLPVRVGGLESRAVAEREERMQAGEVEITSPGGWRLRAPAGMDARRLRELLSVLGPC